MGRMKGRPLNGPPSLGQKNPTERGGKGGSEKSGLEWGFRLNARECKPGGAAGERKSLSARAGISDFFLWGPWTAWGCSGKKVLRETRRKLYSRGMVKKKKEARGGGGVKGVRHRFRTER